jgi:AMMECR1 domain-containing protein
VEIGKHGLYIARNRKRGVFLPEVAVEHGWNPAEFLAQTCIKANLPRTAWQWAGTKIALFTALPIEEER